MLRVLIWAVIVAVVWWLINFRGCQAQAAAGRTVAHTITADCWSGEDLARRYGWPGDWREYVWRIERLNGWKRWPIVQVGEKILVGDYR